MIVAILFGICAGFVLAALLGLVLWRPLSNLIFDAVIRRLLTDPYPENIVETLNVAAKVGSRNLFEADLRGTTGQPLQRPFGTPLHFSPWDRLLFNPVYLTRQPLEEDAAIDTRVILGPRADRPLTLEMPILLGGMAFGIGVSLPVRLALAKAADQLGTAANTGVGPVLPEERQSVKRLIVQYHRGNWGKEDEVLRQAEAIEIQLGYGALGSAPVTIQAKDISSELREVLGLARGQGLKLGAALPDAATPATLADLVRQLRRLTDGVPIGVKIGSTHYLEKELSILAEAEVDFLSIDGAEAGINFSPGLLADDLGLPTLPALCRAARFLEQNRLRGRISLIVGGGLTTPGQFLKALALGADAVSIGTVALMAVSHTQGIKTLPWEPPTELIYGNGSKREAFSPEEGAKSLANFLRSCLGEITLAMRAMGRASLRELGPSDLCALDPEVARWTGVESGLCQPAMTDKSGRARILPRRLR